MSKPFWRETNYWRIFGVFMLAGAAFWPPGVVLSAYGAELSNPPAVVGALLIIWPMLREIGMHVAKYFEGRGRR